MLRNSFLFLSSILYLASCTSCFDKKGDDKSIFLQGHWTVETATRGGEPTALLDGTWFDFFPNGEMETNLQTLEGKSAFSLKKDVIRKDGHIPVDFIIKSISDSSLVLAFEFRTQQFELNLVRGEAGVVPLEEDPTDDPIQPIEPQKVDQ